MSRPLLSRRTWLWTSTTAIAAACARPEPTQLPEGGPEPARELSLRGAANLTALAELGAAIRWLHPSDQAQTVDWESTLLAGIRSLERADSRAELVEGLRGLFAEAAPTVLVWRGEVRGEDDDTLDEAACPEGDESATEAETPKKPKTDASKPATDETENEAESAPTDEGEPEDKDEDEDEDAPEDKDEDAPEDKDEDAPEDKDEDAPEDEDEPADEPEPEPEDKDAPKPDDPTSEASRPDADADDDDDGDAKDAEDEDRPPLHEALRAPDEELEITQWLRQGPDCGRRLRRDPAAPTSEAPADRRRRRQRPPDACPTLDAAATDAALLTPSSVVELPLPRGLHAAVPIALWTRAGQTLPPSEPAPPTPAFDERRAWDYSLADRGTRLLAVIRCWTLMQQFYAHRERVPAPRELLREALCAAAGDEDPAVLADAITTLLAGFADGNAELRTSFGKAARAYHPPLTLAWVENRVVVGHPGDSEARAGDVVTAVDGESIEEVLAQALARTPAATASAAITRTVAGLLRRPSADVSVRLGLRREALDDERERELELELRADERIDRLPPAELRPRPLTEVREGVWYLDATRVDRLRPALRRARKATALIVDLRGSLADPEASILAHRLQEPASLLDERIPTGPDAAGELPLEALGARELEPRGPRVGCPLVVLADSRTRGRAELELAGLEQLGATVVGSASAGGLGASSTVWLPGGWQLRFTTSELRPRDGRGLWGLGVRPSVPVEPSLLGLRGQKDELLEAALAALSHRRSPAAEP